MFKNISLLLKPQLKVHQQGKPQNSTTLHVLTFLKNLQNSISYLGVNPTKPLYQFLGNFQICWYTDVPNFQYFV